MTRRCLKNAVGNGKSSAKQYEANKIPTVRTSDHNSDETPRDFGIPKGVSYSLYNLDECKTLLRSKTTEAEKKAQVN